MQVQALVHVTPGAQPFPGPVEPAGAHSSVPSWHPRVVVVVLAVVEVVTVVVVVVGGGIGSHSPHSSPFPVNTLGSKLSQTNPSAQFFGAFAAPTVHANAWSSHVWHAQSGWH